MRDDERTRNLEVSSPLLAETVSDAYAGPLRPEMEVCDIKGDKVGTVAHIYEPPFPADEPDGVREEIVEVKSGLLGLGAHYWIPRSLVRETLRDSAFLDRNKEELEALGLDQKPPYLAAVVG